MPHFSCSDLTVSDGTSGARVMIQRRKTELAVW